MKKREWFSLVMLALTVMPALLISYNKIFRTGVDGERLMRPETQALLLEIAILFGAAFAIQMLIRSRKLQIGALAIEAAVFTWIHQAFLPMIVLANRRMVDRRRSVSSSSSLHRMTTSVSPTSDAVSSLIFNVKII